MIRQRVHRRWTAHLSLGECLLRECARSRENDWISRYFDWHVARYGEHAPGPWWNRVFGKFVCWLSDWQVTWRIRPPTPKLSSRSPS